MSASRLITLTGPGGVGKTRLAAQAAAEARRGFRDGVWLVELAGLGDAALLAAETARSLGLPDQPARWGAAELSGYLHDRQLLLIADECERLDGAFASFAETLLTGCPELRILATSRHVLGVPGEVTLPVPPMTVPPDRLPACTQDLLQYEAVRLFAERAARVLPGFAVDASNAHAVAALCRGLDGIPLAVELAAGRLRALSPEQIRSRLGSRFRLLSSPGRMGGPRDPALLTAMDGSYGLLTDAERCLWRRISVFSGTFDLTAAEAVCACDEIPSEAIVDLIDGLVAKSILLRCPADADARYRLLDTVRDYGLDKLRSDTGEHALRARHREWYARTSARQDAFSPRRAAETCATPGPDMAPARPLVARHPDTVPARLTPRQSDVASLIAEGLSNNQIAGKLVISVRTVETHVKHIMDKLGFTARAEIAAWSASAWNRS